MFCPSCGIEAQEGQNFCKTCGTDLQIVSETMEGAADTLGQLRVDVDSLKDSVKGFVATLGLGDDRRHGHGGAGRRDTMLSKPVKPKDWLSYSRQHNLKSGLISLLTGAGLGVLLYYLGQTAIETGLLDDIREAANNQLRGLERLASLLWMFALIPVGKGIAQIFYAAFFAESMSTLAARFAPPPAVVKEAPRNQLSSPAVAPPSVTEGTTRIFEGARAGSQRDTR